MNKLLKSGFYELFKSKFFYVTMSVCAILGAVISSGMYMYPNFNIPEGSGIVIDKSNVLSFVPSFAAIFIPFAAASTVALLLDSQYNHGTIRNKLISGHTRTGIFISGLIVSCVSAIIYFVIYEIFTFAVAVIIFGYDKFELTAAAASLSVMLLMIICVGTVLSFVIGNILRGGKMIVVTLAVQYAITFSTFLSFFKNNNTFIDIITRIFPQSYIFNFSYFAIPDKIGLNAVISAVLIVLLTVFGINYFKKCDIK